MKQRHGWLLGLLVVIMLLAACGPDMTTPTAAPEPDNGGGEAQATAPAVTQLPVDPDDWHVLGEPDAPVTMVEYSDFQ